MTIQEDYSEMWVASGLFLQFEISRILTMANCLKDLSVELTNCQSSLDYKKSFKMLSLAYQVSLLILSAKYRHTNKDLHFSNEFFCHVKVLPRS